MTKENTGSKPGSAVIGGSEKNRSAMDRGTSGHVAQRPVSKQSEAIIKKASVRRSTALKLLANR